MKIFQSVPNLEKAIKTGEFLIGTCFFSRCVNGGSLRNCSGSQAVQRLEEGFLKDRAGIRRNTDNDLKYARHGYT